MTHNTTPQSAEIAERKATGLSPRQMFLLDAACAPLRHEFPGFGPFLVGSAMTGERSAGTRDVDVRHIMRDEEYAALCDAIGVDGLRFLGIAVGQYLASLTGLPIDFQFQQQTAANSGEHAVQRQVRHSHTNPVIGCRCAENPSNVIPAHVKPRNPLGVRSMGNFVGDAEPSTRPGMPPGLSCSALWSRNQGVSCCVDTPHTVHRGGSELGAPWWRDADCVPGTLPAGRGGR